MKHASVHNPQSRQLIAHLAEQNEFLNLSLPSTNSQQAQKQKQLPQCPQRQRSRLIGRKERGEGCSLLRSSKSVQQILKEMRFKEESRRKKIVQLNRKIQNEKQYQKKARDFQLAEKRIKYRLKVEERRIKKQKRGPIGGKTSINQVQECKDKDIFGQDKKIQRQKNRRSYSLQTKCKTSLSEVQLSKVTPSKIPTLSASKPLTPLKSFISSSDHQHPSIFQAQKQRKRKIATVPNDLSYSKSSVKKIDYLRQLPKREGKSMEQQLQSLYETQSKDCFGKAAQLVKKIENKQRLRLKNIKEKDYKQARQKLRLLSFFYKDE